LRSSAKFRGALSVFATTGCASGGFDPGYPRHLAVRRLPLDERGLGLLVAHDALAAVAEFPALVQRHQGAEGSAKRRVRRPAAQVATADATAECLGEWIRLAYRRDGAIRTAGLSVQVGDSVADRFVGLRADGRFDGRSVRWCRTPLVYAISIDSMRHLLHDESPNTPSRELAEEPSGNFYVALGGPLPANLTEMGSDGGWRRAHGARQDRGADDWASSRATRPSRFTAGRQRCVGPTRFARRPASGGSAASLSVFAQPRAPRLPSS
jgi:hypothetical protein